MFVWKRNPGGPRSDYSTEAPCLRWSCWMHGRCSVRTPPGICSFPKSWGCPKVDAACFGKRSHRSKWMMTGVLFPLHLNGNSGSLWQSPEVPYEWKSWLNIIYQWWISHCLLYRENIPMYLAMESHRAHLFVPAAWKTTCGDMWNVRADPWAQNHGTGTSGQINLIRWALQIPKDHLFVKPNCMQLHAP